MNRIRFGRACRRIAVIGTCLPLVSVFFVGTASAAQDGVYAVFVAHPDDEADALGGIYGRSTKHKVIVVLTRGEADGLHDRWVPANLSGAKSSPGSEQL